MDVILNGVFELLKFETISRLVTENRQRDTILQGIVLALLVSLREKIVVWIGLVWLHICAYVWKTNATPDRINDVQAQIDAMFRDQTVPFLCVKWDYFRYSTFTTKLFVYCQRYAPGFNKCEEMEIDYSFEKQALLLPDLNRIVILLRRGLRNISHCVLHYENGQIVVMDRAGSQSTDGVCLKANSEEVLRRFYERVMEIELPETTNTEPLIIDGDAKASILQDRDLAHFVSRHKV